MRADIGQIFFCPGLVDLGVSEGKFKLFSLSVVRVWKVWICPRKPQGQPIQGNKKYLPSYLEVGSFTSHIIWIHYVWAKKFELATVKPQKPLGWPTSADKYLRGQIFFLRGQIFFFRGQIFFWGGRYFSISKYLPSQIIIWGQLWGKKKTWEGGKVITIK